MKKTITIDAKQYKAAYKDLYGEGRSRDRFDKVFRNALTEFDRVIQRLSKGWTFDGNGKWIEPPREDSEIMKTKNDDYNQRVELWNRAIEKAALIAEGHSAAMNSKSMAPFQDPLIAGFVIARDFDIAVAIRAARKK